MKVKIYRSYSQIQNYINFILELIYNGKITLMFDFIFLQLFRSITRSYLLIPHMGNLTQPISTLTR